MAWKDRTRERFNRRGSLTGVMLLALGVVAVLIAIFLLRNTWPG
jgi:hypothetical protein